MQAGEPVPTYVGQDGHVYITLPSYGDFRSEDLAVFYMTKKWPKWVKHIDGNMQNNVWANLEYELQD